MSDWNKEVSSLGDAYASMYNKDTEQLDEVSIGGLNFKTIADGLSKGFRKGYGRGGQGNRGARRPTGSDGRSTVAPNRSTPSKTPTKPAAPSGSSSGSSGSSGGSSTPSAPARKPQSKDMDANMRTWAKANPKLAAKVKPGQSGYKAINSAPSKTSGATAIGKAAAPKPAAPKPAAKPSGIKSARLSSALSNIPKFKAEHAEELIGYLIDEGFANNKENAEIILTHMSDEWLESLITE